MAKNLLTLCMHSTQIVKICSQASLSLSSWRIAQNFDVCDPKYIWLLISKRVPSCGFESAEIKFQHTSPDDELQKLIFKLG